jgi:hypothetical protein
LPWIFKLAEGKNLPTIDEVWWTPPILTVMKNIMNYKPFEEISDTLEYVYEYIGGQNYILKYIDLNDIPYYLSNCTYEQSIRLLEKLNLNGYMTAELYVAYKNYCYDEEDSDITEEKSKNVLIKEYIKTTVNWNTMFLVKINHWIACEGSYQASEFVTIINELWNKYEDKISQLQDPINKKDWLNLTKNPWKDEMHDFLSTRITFK